jgi:hypothetical protein
MRILDINNIEIENPDLSLGKLVGEKIFIAHHEATEAIEEQFHYEVVKEYPNGGRDVKKVTDVEATEEKDAWDEYEDIYRYVLYTEEELAQIEVEKNKPTQLDVIESQVFYTAMMTDTLLED